MIVPLAEEGSHRSNGLMTFFRFRVSRITNTNGSGDHSLAPIYCCPVRCVIENRLAGAVHAAEVAVIACLDRLKAPKNKNSCSTRCCSADSRSDEFRASGFPSTGNSSVYRDPLQTLGVRGEQIESFL